MKRVQNHKTLYRESFEKDACGIGFIANILNEPSHTIITKGLAMLENMEHRGGRGAEPETGDGAGIMIQIPHEFFVEEMAKQSVILPEKGQYGVGVMYMHRDDAKRALQKRAIAEAARDRDFTLLGSRRVPVNPKYAGPSAIAIAPVTEQFFVKPNFDVEGPKHLERKLFVLRKLICCKINTLMPDEEIECYFPSFSHSKLIYKGQLHTAQLRFYYPDLMDKRLMSAFAMIHSRFSTNTFPKWSLAQPFRFIAHNGEINTIKGNVIKMKSKEALMDTQYFTREEMDILLPICNSKNSDSANLDAMVELLTLCGRQLPHVLTMLVPEAWQDNKMMSEPKKAYYKYHASMMEPWDGPAAICFTDGSMIGATLDRNGLRPGRYCITSDHHLIVASEAGAVIVDQAKIIKKGRLQPGKMILADLERGIVKEDREIKHELSAKQPYSEWIKGNRSKLRLMPTPEKLPKPLTTPQLRRSQRVFGYTSEDLKVILGPMAVNGKEPLGSMGADTPLAVLSNEQQHLANYFKQNFAQVSNPAIDPIRERLVMSLFTRVGSSLNILDETPEHCRQIHISQPVLDKENFQKLVQLNHPQYKVKILDALFNSTDKKGALEKGLDELCKKAEQAVRDGHNIVIISDRKSTKSKAPIPSLLAIGAVHHHLVNQKLRASTGLVLEAGDVVEVHHFATCVGFGASAVYPYVAIETLLQMKDDGMVEAQYADDQLIEQYITAVGNGLLKVMSKMGISTLQSYQSAQIFEILGLGDEVVDKCFTGTISRIGGIDFDDIASEVVARHQFAWDEDNPNAATLPVGGIYQWKRNGEVHLFTPETIHLLQQSTRRNDYDLYKKYAALINNQEEKAITIRSLLDFKKGKSIPLDDVEPVENILTRFATGAMSFGSISHEAHSTLAIAMNRIGARSNSGEGGEDEIRFERKPNGDWERSAIKQIASGRFGVNSYYLSNAIELQIKISQGAKPGEGGQLPGHKVDEWIGRVRHSTPGVGLISPPPHHDIYSIEDLAQLIYDLKNANREARVNVKLVAETGVGTVAAGVAKGMADAILISGADGGTGASPLSSIRHAGLPWELGLSEAHQTLVKNDLRSRTVLQTDGKIKTGRDLAVATLLGAEEWGVSTAALVVEGCIMMRKCHLNTCPVGIATQRPELRELFTGEADHVVNLFTFMAQELREIMAELGYRTVNEMIGQADRLKMRENITHPKIKKLDLTAMFARMPEEARYEIYHTIPQRHRLDNVLDRKLIKLAQLSLDDASYTEGRFQIVNTDRAVGAMLSNEISKLYKGHGLPEGTIRVTFRGSAGQSFGAFAAPGIKFILEGEANDYFGKGLSGAQLIVYPDRKSIYKPDENIIIGNVALYGATAGEVYVNGMAGERFAVRNSGALAVVEGVGDHGCEYMTGGRVVILGETGKNFAAGMSGGIAYVFDPHRKFEQLCNRELVDFDRMDYDDVQLIKRLITNQLKFTGSKVAEEILAMWSEHLPHFVKVMPREYKAALAKRSSRYKQAV